MSPNIPTASLPVLGPTPKGEMGGVPWNQGVLRALVLQGLRAAASFDRAPGAPLLVVTDSDNDLDGPGGWQDDPTGEPQTSLRDAEGVSCDSRTFPGVVVSPVLTRKPYRVQLSDFCLVAWQGNYCSAQVYDIGPTRKAGENSLYVNRFLGIVPKAKSDHWAALNGHDAQDVCTLVFPGSGPGHAVPPAEIIARTHALWARFTGRAPGGVAAPTKGSGAASGSVGLAVPLCLSAVLVALPCLPVHRLLAATPPAEIGIWLGCASFVMSFILTGLHIRRELRPDPPFDKKYATKEEMTMLDGNSQRRAKENEQRIKDVESRHATEHATNVKHLEKLEGSIDRNYEALQERHDKLAADIRHDVRVELQAAELKAETRFEKQIDRLTDVVRGLGRVEGAERGGQRS